ncbi:MAG: nuclear transport factor 2 family protein [Actinomycetota bacterium]
MARELEAVVRQMLGALDAGDVDGLIRLGADDIQGIDEISRRWNRGIEAVGGYLKQLASLVEEVRSEIGDVHEAAYGDIGIVTFWLEQDYTLEGKRIHVSCPTTTVLRREGGEWRYLLFHSIPLPEGDGA